MGNVLFVISSRSGSGNPDSGRRERVLAAGRGVRDQLGQAALPQAGPGQGEPPLNKGLSRSPGWGTSARGPCEAHLVWPCHGPRMN